MRHYLLRRLLITIPTLFGVTLLIFMAMRVLPGDPMAMITSETSGTVVLSDADLQKVRASLGLDRPLYQQYLSWMWDVARGDLGKSFWRNDPIRDTILRRAPITAQIAFMAILFAWLVGIPIGVLSAIRRNTIADYMTRLGVIFFVGTPSFWIGLLFITVSILVLQWRPPLTIIYLWDDPLRNLQMTVGPAIVLGLGVGAGVARMTRSTILEVVHEDYVRAARAKGLNDRLVIWRHVLRNALLPVVTISGLALGGLLGGSVAVERAFGVPGLGASLVLAMGERDWMMIQNLTLLYAVIFTLINLAVDLSYGLLDPRIRVK